MGLSNDNFKRVIRFQPCILSNFEKYYSLSTQNNLTHHLIHWFDHNQREMPWRLNKDPYRIWLSEIILQQTQVKQGIPYFNKFITAYPTVNSLALANEDELLKMWQGLGYYSRARNLHFTAKYVSNNLQGIFPTNYSDLLKLKGVGEYTAAAIASIAYNEPVAVLDGNVVRVLSRLFEINETVQSAAGLQKFRFYANEILNKTHPGVHNQAMMELGSLVCKPTQPLCNICPIYEHCSAFLHKSIVNFPVKKKKIKVKNRYLTFIVPCIEDGKTLLVKRTGNDIWKNLYTFPCIETEAEWDMNHMNVLMERMHDMKKAEIGAIKKSRHVLTHLIIHATFLQLKIYQKFDLESFKDALDGFDASNSSKENTTLNQQKYATLEKSNIFEVDLNELNKRYALPRLISRYLESMDWNLILN